MTDDEVPLVLARLAALWPTRFKPIKGMATVWAEDIGDLDYPAVVAVLKMLAAEPDSWPPSSMAVRERLLAAADPTGPKPAEDALVEVERAIREVGTGGPNWTLARLGRSRTDDVGHPIWSHPAIAMACDAMGGWAEVCGHTNREAFRAHFLRVYDAMTRRSRAVAVLTEKDRRALESQGAAMLGEIARNAIKRVDAEVPGELPHRPGPVPSGASLG